MACNLSTDIPLAIRSLLVLAIWLPALAMPTSAWSQELPDVGLMKTLPIDLDADSSEFDRKHNLLRFYGLKITQGPLQIEADSATASRLDFENTRWEFTGNVRIKNLNTLAHCDYADIHFQEHRIRNAIMRGQPVQFSQENIAKNTLTEGHAITINYDVDAGVISMSEDAWLSDGANEVSGNRISYDLIREYIIADADESGQVRMKIIPPETAVEQSGVEQLP